MQRLRFFIKVVIISSFFFASVCFGSMVAAKKNGVKVRATSTRSGKILQTLQKGDSLEAIERKGMYWKVKTTDGTTGFVSVLKVKRRASGSNSLSRAIKKAAIEGREEEDQIASGRARSAVMGVRGLSENDETAMAGNVKPNLRMVYMMEDRRISSKKVRALERSVMSEVEIIAKRKGVVP